MKCFNCIYYPCGRIECEAHSNCEFYKSIIDENLIDKNIIKERNEYYE